MFHIFVYHAFLLIDKEPLINSAFPQTLREDSQKSATEGPFARGIIVSRYLFTMAILFYKPKFILKKLSLFCEQPFLVGLILHYSELYMVEAVGGIGSAVGACCFHFFV